MFTRILHANDGSDQAYKALRVAMDLASRCGAELHMICVEGLPHLPSSIGEIEEARRTAERHLGPAISRAKRLARRRSANLIIHRIGGHPARTISEFAEAHGHDLLAIGFTGHSALYEALVGGTAKRLLRLAPCSVLVVK